MAETMNSLRSLFRQWASYFSGKALMLMGGLISLPIMTRLLNKDDYGIMSLVFLAVTLTTSIGSLGFPQATTRYYSEYARQGYNHGLIRFCNTMMLGAVLAGLGSMATLFLGSIILGGMESYGEVANYLKLVLIIVVVRIVSSVFLQILRAEQITLVYNIFALANRYLALGASILLVALVYESVSGVFVGTICAELLVATAGFIYLLRRERIGSVRPSYGLIRKAAKFGFPLVVADFMVTVVSSSDRFIIQYYLDSEAVANYSVAYDISEYVAITFVSPLQLAILPIMYALWSKQGSKATQAFINKAVNITLLIAIPIVAGFAVVGPDVIVILASRKYSASSEVVPYVSLGVMLGALNFLFFTGLLLYEKTVVITVLNGIAAIVNLWLNVIMVPHYGVIGAAYATIFTYLMLNVITFYVSGRHLKVVLDWLMLAKAIVIAWGMLSLLLYISVYIDNIIANLLIKVMVGIGFYSILLFLAEKKVRRVVREGIAAYVR